MAAARTVVLQLVSHPSSADGSYTSSEWGLWAVGAQVTMTGVQADALVAEFPGAFTSISDVADPSASDLTVANKKVIEGDSNGLGQEVDPDDLTVGDAANLYTATTLEAQLAEIRTTQVLKAATAKVVAVTGGVLTVDQAVHTVTGAATSADDVDTISGLSDAGWADLITGAYAITYRDATTGSGNISTPNNVSLVTATGDVVRATRIGAVVFVEIVMVQAGMPVSMLDAVPDSGSLWTATGLAAILQEARTTDLFKAAIDATISTPADDLPLVQAIHTVRGNGAAPDDVDTISGIVSGQKVILITGAEAITYKDSGTLGLPNNIDLVTATGDIVLAILSGSVPKIVPLWIQAGLPVGMLDAVADVGNYYTQTTLTLMLQEIFSSALGGTSTVRAYSGGTSQEPADNATLTDAIASEMLNRRQELLSLILDQATPTASAGRGLVISGGVVAAQGAPDLTVSVTALDAINQTGKRIKPVQVLILSGFTIPSAGGAERRDIVVCDSTGAIVRRVGPEGAPTQADATLSAGDVPLARVVLTQGIDTTIAAGNIADLRQTAQSIDSAKILPIPDSGSLFVATGLAAMLQELRTTALLKSVIDATPTNAAPAELTLVQAAHTTRGFGAAPDNVDSILGLSAFGLAFLVTGAEAITYRDATTGSGNIAIRGNASITTATGDIVLAVLSGSDVRIVPLFIQAGVPSESTTPGSTGNTATGVSIGTSGAGGTGASGGSGGSTVSEIWTTAFGGLWGRDVDLVYGAGGAGMVGHALLDLTLTALGAGKAQVYNADNTSYSPVETAPGVNRTVNWQMLPDVPANGDRFIVNLGSTPKSELAYDLSALVGSTGNAFAWFESRAGNTWGAMAPAYDGTDLTAGDGQRAFDRSGAQVWNVSSALWVSAAFGTQTGYQVCCEVVDATKIGVVPVLNSKRPEVVTPTVGFRAPKTGTITDLRIRDNAATIHTANDVFFYLCNFSANTSTLIQQWAQDTRVYYATGLTLAVTAGDKLGIVVVSEDGTNEIMGGVVELTASVVVADHTHTGPSHDHAAGAITDAGHTHTSAAHTHNS